MTLNRVTPVFVLLLGSLWGGDIQAEDTPKDMVEYFTSSGFSTPVAIVNSPAGVYVNGVTYVTYQGAKTDPYIASYHHETQEWQGPYKAGTSLLGKDEASAKDSHGKPTMLIDNDEYIHLFFGGHGGSDAFGENELGNVFRGMNKHVVSVKPYDISEFEELDNISPFGNYNQAIKMDNGDIYLFYRHGAHRSNWVYQKSTDNARTFSEPVSFLEATPRTDIDAHHSWYAWATKGSGDDIIVSYDYHVCWNITSAPFKARGGHFAERNNLYYMVFNTQTGIWRNVSGEELKVPVTYEAANAKALVTETGLDNWTFNGSVHLDENNYPHVTINTGRDLGKINWGGPKQTEYYRWNGQKWLGGNTVHPNANNKNLDTRGDFFLNDEGGFTFALGYKEGEDEIISYFEYDQKNQCFSKVSDLVKVKNANWAMSPMIENAHPDARFLAAEKVVGEKEWRRMYLVGDHGAVKRVESEANQ
ncbi:hypothetical protein RJ45_06595 [Photobacterium gaetbulicola]|uniref:Uncharacterized protein n=1 Tax=Photobacterium gaetbulicola TaxID=1295392 RepID=A0A0B9H087_9GAMM|nr:BNR-4 repeat-containing protein [Photobacterium gaetbulicola]KHT64381.1 hypothetical protein RJ45_06595 [Photobacterium gaetbulicola]